MRGGGYDTKKSGVFGTKGFSGGCVLFISSKTLQAILISRHRRYCEGTPATASTRLHRKDVLVWVECMGRELARLERSLLSPCRILCLRR